MTAAEWPLDITEQIIDALSSPYARDPWQKAGLRKPLIGTLRACSLVSRTFYWAASRELWKELPLFYVQNRPTANADLDRLLQVLTNNPSLHSYIRIVIVDISSDLDASAGSTAGDETPRGGNQGERPPFATLSKLLTVLASAAVEELWLRSKWHGSTPQLMKLEDELLFALTTLRCTPSLKECHFRSLGFKPPTLILFGDPTIDKVQKVSFIGGSYLQDEAASMTSLIPYDSPFLSVSGEAYARACQAMQNVALPVPLLPRVTHLSLRGCDFLWAMLRERGRVGNSETDVWAGHLPSLQELDIRGARSASDISIALQTKPTLQRVDLEVCHVRDCEALRGLEDLPNLRELRVCLDIRAVEWRRGQGIILRQLLSTMTLILQAMAVSQPLEVLRIECWFRNKSPVGYRALLHPNGDWKRFEESLQSLSSRLGSSKRVKVELEIHLSVRAFSEEYLASVGDIIAAAPAILPEAVNSMDISLNVRTFNAE